MPSRFRQDAKTGAAVPVPSEASGPDVPVVPGASVVSAAADTDGDGAAQPAAVVGTVPAAEALSGFPFLQAVSAVRHHTMSRSRSARYGFGFVIGHPLFLGGGVRTIPNPMPKRPGRDLTSPGHGDTVFSRVRPAYGMVLLYKRHFRGTSLLPKRNTMSVSPARSKPLCS